MSGLLNFLQGASNAAASNVSAPVDGLAWLLKKAGVNVGTPVGGADWMRQQGLTADAPGLGGLLGESVGGVLPMVAAAKAPQIASGLLKVGENAAARPMLNPQTGAIVWHGSPHKFDKFDSSKIGTGEGAQAYGHGLYLAESPDVARSYQEALSSTGQAKHVLSQNAGDVDAALKQAEASVQNYRALIANGGGGDARRAQSMLSIAEKKLEDLRRMKAGLPEDTGALYKVDLPDEKIARMLDWDKPLSQQHPDTAMALEALRESARKSFPAIADGDPTGRGIYSAYQAHRGGNQSAASDKLRELGIPGIRYLDGGSRGAGAGSSNFVVFPGEESALKILERNGGLLK